MHIKSTAVKQLYSVAAANVIAQPLSTKITEYCLLIQLS